MLNVNTKNSESNRVWKWAGIVVLVVVALFAWTRVAPAQEPECFTPQQLQQQFEKNIPEGYKAVIEEYHGSPIVKAFLDNAARVFGRAPAEFYDATSMLVVTTKEIDKVGVAFFRNGCFIKRAIFPKNLYAAVMRMAQKEVNGNAS